jgi:hypothetical protein
MPYSGIDFFKEDPPIIHGESYMPVGMYSSPYYASTTYVYRVEERIVYRNRGRILPVGMAWAIFGLFAFISIASFVMMVITR